MGVSREPIQAWSLPDLVPGVVALHHPLGVLVHLTCEQGSPSLVWVQRFTPNELTVLLPLLAWYPDYCPLEVELASFFGSASEQAVARARTQLYAAMDAGEIEPLLRPLRNVISRVRLKLRGAGMEIATLISLGYVLKPVRRLPTPGASVEELRGGKQRDV